MQIEMAMEKAKSMPGIMKMAKAKAKDMLGIKDVDPKSFLVKKGKKQEEDDDK